MSKQPIFYTSKGGGDDAPLLCPVYSGRNLHQEGDIRDYDHGKEYGIKIDYWCEGCPAKSTLTISEYKGSVYMDFSEKRPISAEDGEIDKLWGSTLLMPVAVHELC